MSEYITQVTRDNITIAASHLKDTIIYSVNIGSKLEIITSSIELIDTVPKIQNITITHPMLPFSTVLYSITPVTWKGDPEFVYKIDEFKYLDLIQSLVTKIQSTIS